MIKKLISSLLLAASVTGAWAQFNLTLPKDMPTKLVYSNRNVTIRESPSTTGRKLGTTWQDFKMSYGWVSSSSSDACSLDGYAKFIEEKDGWYNINYSGFSAWVSAKYSSLVNVETISDAEFARYAKTKRMQQCPGKYKDYYLRVVESDELGGSDGLETLYIYKYIDGILIFDALAYVDLNPNANELEIEKSCSDCDEFIYLSRKHRKANGDIDLSKITEAEMDKLAQNFHVENVNGKNFLAKINGKITEVNL